MGKQIPQCLIKALQWWIRLMPIFLRSTHLVLHILTFTFLLCGILNLPEIPAGKHRRLAAIHNRAKIWLVFELIFVILAIIMMISTVINMSIKNPPRTISVIKNWFLQNCPNYSFFYYVLLSLFVLYGAMVGCNIPHLFHNFPGLMASPSKMKSAEKKMQTWQKFIITAVVSGIINSILYFIAAFFPVEDFEAGRNAGEANKELVAQAPIDSDINQKEKVNQDIGGLAVNQGEGETEVKSVSEQLQ